jgi:MFS family permease
VSFSIGVVFKPLMWEFGWDRGLISLAFFLNMTIYAVSLIFVGKYYDRYGPKWVIIISNIFFLVFVTFMFICGSADFMITTHLIPLVTDYNISPTTAGNMLAWLGLMSLAG